MSPYYVSMRTRPDILAHLTFLTSHISDCRESSHSGLHVTLGDGGIPPPHYGGPIVVRSHVQKLVTLSSCEAELNAVHQYQHQFHYLRSLMTDFGFDQSLPSIVLHNNATMTLLNRGDSTNVRNSHFKVRIKFSKQMIDNRVIEYQRCPTENADVPSKPMHALADMPKLMILSNDEFSVLPTRLKVSNE
jgi:hypothetical protein